MHIGVTEMWDGLVGWKAQRIVGNLNKPGLYLYINLAIN